MSAFASYSGHQTNQYLYDIQTMLIGISSKIADECRSLDEVQSLLDKNSFSMGPETEGIYFISNDMNIYSNSMYDMNKSRAKQIYNQTVMSGERMETVGPYNTRAGVLMTFSMNVRKGSDYQGVLAYDIKQEKIINLLSAVNTANDISMLLLDNRYTPITSSVKIHLNEYEDFSKVLKNTIEKGIYGEAEVKSQGTENHYILYIQKIAYQDWNLVYFANKEILISKIGSYKSVSLLLAVVFLAITALFSLYLAFYIEKPIKKFINQNRRIMQGNLSSRIEIKRRDEFHIMVRSFNDMLDYIERLIQENKRIEAMKKKFQLRSLQYQINPHFLYNTLNSINSLLDLKQAERIPSVVNSLVSLFQYSVHNDDEWSDVGTELEHLKKYINLQQIRYEDKFAVEYEVDELVLKCKILKLTLQPIVENAIFHGIRGKKGKGLIKIGGGMNADGKSVTIYIEDDGIGMSHSTLCGLLEREDGRNEEVRLKGLHSIGLHNVNERIKLYFGYEYGLSVKSDVNSGTRVEINIPIVRGETQQ